MFFLNGAFLLPFSNIQESAAATKATAADHSCSRSTFGAVVVLPERNSKAVSFGSPFSNVGNHLSAAALR